MPDSSIKVSIPESVVNALHIAVIRAGGGNLANVTRQSAQEWIDKLTAAKIVTEYAHKDAGLPFAAARGPIKKGYHPIMAHEPIIRFGVRITPDQLEQLDNIAYWRGVYRSQVIVEGLASWLAVRDTEGLWADWLFDYPGAIVPPAVKLTTGLQLAYTSRAFAKDNRVSFASPTQDRPNGGRHA
jgi:hypothetical protein